MSKLQKLAIQGIRSFGPEDQRRMDFFSPLTLILGQNGCGKTTIIESLKFITTGEVPPGCGKGASFVHDPKMAKEAVVRGQIKLRFLNAKGHVITASRSVEVIQKAKRLEFSSLDSTITVEGPDGRKTSVSSKCLDFHAEMISQLGIAKPILENVIFCHQEDSNWPLDEGKKVKEKFDSIFNATKYIKCLDSIRKLRKDKKQALSHMQETLEALKMKKEIADRLRKDHCDADAELLQFRSEKSEIEAESLPARRRLAEIEKIESRINKIKLDIRDKEIMLQGLSDLKAELKSTQRESFDCSDSELAALIENFELEAVKQKAELTQLNKTLNGLCNEIDQLKQKEASCHRFVGQLEASHKIHEENIQKRDKDLSNLASKYEIKEYLGHVNFQMGEADGLLQIMKRRLDKKRENLKQEKFQFDKAEFQLEKEIETIRHESTVYQQQITMLTDQVKEIEAKSKSSMAELASLKKELVFLNSSDVRRKLDIINGRIEESKQELDIKQLNEDITVSRESKIGLETELSSIKSKISKLNQQAEYRSQLDIHVKDKEGLEQKNKFLRAKHSDDFASLFQNNVVEGELKRAFDNASSENKRQLKLANAEKFRLDKSKTELLVKIENEKKSIAKRELDVKNFENKLEDLISGKDLESAIDQCKDEIDELVKSMSEQESAVKVMERFREKINDGQGCPLCHRDFDSETHREDLITEIGEKLGRLPQSLETCKENLKRKEAFYDQLLRLRPAKAASDDAHKDLDSLRLQLKEYQKQRDAVNCEVDSNLADTEVLSAADEALCRIQSDVITIDGNSKSVANLRKKINSLHDILGASADDFVSMEDLLNQQESLEKKISALRARIDQANEKKLLHQEHMQKLEKDKYQFSLKLKQIETKESEASKLKKDLEDFNGDLERRTEEIENKNMALAPVDYQLKEKLAAKNRLTSKKNEVVESRDAEIQSIMGEINAVDQLHSSVQKYVNENRQNQLEEAKDELNSILARISVFLERKNSVDGQIRQTSSKLDMQSERKMALDCEQKIRQKEVEGQTIAKVISAKKSELQSLDVCAVGEEKDEIIASINKNLQRNAVLDGKIEELHKKKKEVEKQLNSNEVKNAQKKYTEKLIEMKCIDLACKDLNKYYQALDTAVMRFHRDKMSIINAIIRELWKSTYRGNDIDHIEIKTDETESQGADKRRTYNYRVVMVKNDTEMDMRGRCSAGQKVLASLIIRMALAETFSANCGILTLDEPTTNLDRENIEALSLALLNIVNKRSLQRNFQLIVITHDGEFLERLTRADFIEYYYKVSRDQRGLSMISRLSTQCE